MNDTETSLPPLRFIFPLVPTNCMICGAKCVNYEKGKRFEPSEEVFYTCGTSFVINHKSIKSAGFLIQIADCFCGINLRKSEVSLEYIKPKKNLFEESYWIENLKNIRKVYPKIRGNKPFRNESYYVLYRKWSMLINDFPYFEKVSKNTKIHYGEGAVPLFTTEAKAKKYAREITEITKDKIDRNFYIEHFYLEHIFKIAIPEYSHAVIDPVDEKLHKDSDLCDFTTLRF